MSITGRILAFVAFFALFPFGFFLVQASRRSISWRKALKNTGILLLVHAAGGFLILQYPEGYPSITRLAGFLLWSINIWLGYDWQVKGMTSGNGYASWQRPLKWIGWTLKTLAAGNVILNLSKT